MLPKDCHRWPKTNPFQSCSRLKVISVFWDQKFIPTTSRPSSPIDYAVSWGLFAQPEIARHITVNQYNRYLNWKMDRVPVPIEQAKQMVSNMHIIPSNPQIAKAIKQVKRGDLVRLQGELVEVRDKDLIWKSSLTPTDTGDGACEVFRVSSIKWIEKVGKG